MKETQMIQEWLSEAGIQFSEVYEGNCAQCPICAGAQELAA